LLPRAQGSADDPPARPKRDARPRRDVRRPQRRRALSGRGGGSAHAAHRADRNAEQRRPEDRRPATGDLVMKPKIAALPNGPYYLLHDMIPAEVPNLRRQNGEACANVRGIALCRCGGSKNKPFCDGTHSSIGFKSERL